ncbi:hypothetical protein [Antiquaquibacter soli]|uniref:Large exoprotein n=1 Tax=Antiquaquibacter soli TaxID=3064523 RepID=A0ABT9BR40_9MICO|nr:hypothetical protein [Protaetiibacter sp. WY-16]MDO7883488.1 hypothetical protein [Protaetiibacter sp. WY-16]
MELTGLGGGIMLAIAAGLWLVYLVPSWLKRREYMATERNAVRLQQTIRVLAETTEAPTQALRRAPAGPVAVGRPVQPAPRPAPHVLAAQRLRRTRMLAAAVLLGSVVVALAQIPVLASGAAAGGSWLVLGGAGLAALCAVALLGRLAEVSRARRAPAVVRRSQGIVDHQFESEQPVRTEWTPVPVPKPMYLSRGEAPTERASASDLAESLRRAAAEAEEALRAAEPPAVQPAAAGPPVAPAATSRFAAMGVVDDSAIRTPDLDAALERRRVG